MAPDHSTGPERRIPEVGPASGEARYEPGGWGDVLKGTWAARALDAVMAARSEAAITILDPFAGAPTYPMTEAARERLRQVHGGGYAALQAAFARRDAVASTGRGLLEVARGRGRAAGLRVFDADPDRLRAWRGIAGVELLEAPDGAAVLEAAAAQDVSPDLLLVDPYDLFDHWGALVRPLVILVPRCPALLYLYNKSPRGAGHYDQYRRCVAGLARALPDAAAGILGRVPADARLPRAWHEVMLLGPAPWVARLSGPLAQETRALARLLADQGAFDALPPDP